MGKTLEIKINGDIGFGFDSEMLMNQLEGFEGKEIKVPINSYGGSVLEGLAMYNILKGRSEKVTTSVIGFALSMGGVLLQAGAKREMPDNSFLMLHRVRGGAFGNGDEAKGMAEAMLKMDDMIARIYAKKSKATRSEVLKMMDGETWLTAKEALAIGFVDKLTSAAEFENSFKPGMKEKYEEVVAQFNNKPKTNNKMGYGFLDFLNNKKEVQNDDEAKELIENKISEAVTTATSDLTNEVAGLRKQIENNKDASERDATKAGNKDSGLEKRINSLAGKLTKLENSVGDLTAENTAFKDSITEKDEAINKLESDVDTATKAVETATAAVDKATEAKEAVQAENAKVSTKNEALEAANKKLASATGTKPVENEAAPVEITNLIRGKKAGEILEILKTQANTNK